MNAVDETGQARGSEPEAGGRWEPRRHLLFLLLLLLVSLAKIAIYWHSAALPSATFLHRDSSGYYEPANALVRLGRYSISPAHPEIPETVRTPGYPAFIATVFLACGESLRAVILVQLLMSLASLSLIYCLAARLWDPRAGLAAACLFAVDVLSAGYTFLVMSETLFTFLLICMLVAVYAFFRRRHQLWAASALGFLLGLATLTRPITSYFIAPLAAGLLMWLILGHVHWTRIALVLAIVAVPYVLLVGSWRARNYHLTGHAYMSQIEGFNLLFFNAAGVIAQRNDISHRLAREQLIDGRQDAYGLLEHSHLRPADGMPEMWREKAIRVIQGDPIAFVLSQARGTVNVFWSAGDSELNTVLGRRETQGPLGDLRRRISLMEFVRKWMAQRPTYFLVFAIGTLGLYAVYSGIVVYFACVRREAAANYAALGCFAGLILYLAVLSGGPAGQYRFRVPLMPVLALFAGRGWSLLVEGAAGRNMQATVGKTCPTGAGPQAP
jgi:4-amino-4-deoxy-L-arabinose transferase-like glycosyltransferase